jgi:predicted metalloprotease
VGVVRSATGISQYLTACQAIDTECTTIAYPSTICMDCQAAEVTDDEASVEAPKISQQTLIKEKERVTPVTSTEVEQIWEEIFKDKESEFITYKEDESEEEELQTYAHDSTN